MRNPPPAKFTKETVLPPTDPASPFFTNLPPSNTRPVDELVQYFRQWKHFIKALIVYLKEIAATKEFNASINYQLISAISFPGLEDLPKKVTQWIQDSYNSPTSTPRQEVKRSLSADNITTTNNTSTASLSCTQSNHTTTSTNSSDGKRPPLFSNKSNSSFLKLGSKSHHNQQQQSSLLPPKSKTSSNPTSPTLRPVSHKRDNASISSLTSVLSSGDGSNPERGAKFPDPLSNVELESFANYFTSNSIFTGVPTILLKYHLNGYGANTKSHRDITTKMIPRLENLFKTVSSKIKELKTYVKNDSFANTEVLKEISRTGKILSEFTNAVERYNGQVPVAKGRYVVPMPLATKTNPSSELKSDEEDADTDASKKGTTTTAPDNDEDNTAVSDDPFLVKLRLDHQIKYQLLQENYKFASYMNLQNIARDIFAYMYKELSSFLMKLGKLSSNEYAFGNDPLGGLYLMLKERLQTTSSEEFEHFAINNAAFINIYKDSGVNFRKESRLFSHLKIPYHDSIHSKCLRFGPLYKKSKIMKNYSCHYFLLTCNYLHEFKLDMNSNSGNESMNGNGGGTVKNSSSNQKKTKVKAFIGPDDIPVKSYNLNEYSIKPKNDDVKGFKFVLCKRSNMSRKSTFKCLDEREFDGWYNDLYELLKFGSKHLERFALVQEKLEARDSDLSHTSTKKNHANLKLDLKNQPMNVPITPNLSPYTSHEVGISSSSLTVNNQNEALSGIFTPRVISPKQSQEFPFHQGGNFSVDTNQSSFTSESSHSVTPALTPPNGGIVMDEENTLQLQESQLLREKINEVQRQRMQVELDGNHVLFSDNESTTIPTFRDDSQISPNSSRPPSFIEGHNNNNNNNNNNSSHTTNGNGQMNPQIIVSHE